MSHISSPASGAARSERGGLEDGGGSSVGSPGSRVGLERARNVDVGARIGRNPKQNNNKPVTLEQQEKQLKARREGDETIERAAETIKDCYVLRELDRCPCLPGIWTLELHHRVVANLDKVEKLCIEAAELLKRGNALDRMEALDDVREQAEEVRRVAELTKLGEEGVIKTLETVQEGARLGWPWGEETFKRSAELAKVARGYFEEAGLTGFGKEDGRMLFKETMLRRMEHAVTFSLREAQKKRVPVQKLQQLFKSSTEDSRLDATRQFGEIGRLPIPMVLAYNGVCAPATDDATWVADPASRGDAEVVECVCLGLRDPQPKVRVVAVDVLLKVLSWEDPRALEELGIACSDPNIYVKRAVIAALRRFLPNPKAAELLCAFLSDQDQQTRLAAMSALPKSGDEDDAGAEQVLLGVLGYLQHKRRRDVYPHWITEERDVIVAALCALERMAPKGHREVTRKVLSLLANSALMAVTNFIGVARDPLKPLVGRADDWGQSRGPVSVELQLQALAREPEAGNLCRCGPTAEHVRLACIRVLAVVAITADDVKAYQEERALAGSDGTKSKEEEKKDAKKGDALAAMTLHASVVQGLCGALGDFVRDVRWAASAVLGEVADRDESMVVQTLATLLTSPMPDIRAIPYEILKGQAHGRLVSPFCREMMEETVALLASSVRDTRAAAAKAMQILCPQGGGGAGGQGLGEAVALVAELMSDPRDTVRQASLDTLCKVVPGAGREAAAALEPHLSHEDARVRALAVFAIEEVAPRDEELALMVFDVAGLDPSPDVRVAVLHAVASMSERGSADAVACCVDGCTDPSDAVRRSAVEGLTRLSFKGDGEAIGAGMALLQDPSAMVRLAAMETVAGIAQKGDEGVCAAIVARIQAEPDRSVRVLGHAALASLRQMPWSNERAVQFSGGTPAHSPAFWWSKPEGGLRIEGKMRMPGGVPLTDAAAQRTTLPATRDASMNGVLVDAPVGEAVPTHKVIDMQFAVRPKTTEGAAEQGTQRIGSPGEGRPGTGQSGGSELSRMLFGPSLLVDTDGGYDHMFGMMVLLMTGMEPSLVTTMHGTAESLDGAVSMRRLMTTFGLYWIPVVPSNPERPQGRFDSRPGTAPLRGPSTTRRVPSRFGPDYRQHLKRLPDYLNLAPLGLSQENLVGGPGLLSRIDEIKKGILRGYAGNLPRKDVHRLEEGLVRIEKMLAALDKDARKNMATGAGALLEDEGDKYSMSSGDWSEGLVQEDEGEDEQSEVQQGSARPQSGTQSRGGGSPKTRPMPARPISARPVSARPVSALQGSASVKSPASSRIGPDDASSNDVRSPKSGASPKGPPMRTGVDAAAAAILGKLSDVQDGSATLLCLGSLSTIAGALAIDADLLRNKVRGIVVMGGALGNSPVHMQDSAYYSQGGAEFNFHYHPQAVHDVFHSGLDITMVGLDVANAEACSKHDTELLTKTEGESVGAAVMRQIVKNFDLAPAYASVACFYLVSPESFTTEKRWLDIDPHSGVVTEALPGKQGAVLVRVALEMRKEYYFEYLRDLMSE